MKIFLWVITGLLALAAALVVGGVLLLKRPDIGYAELRDAYAYPESQWADLPTGVKMHFRDIGPRSAPVILLVHGFSASLHTWDAWGDALADSFRVISLDLPGHGLTEAPTGYQASIEAFRDDVAAFAALQGLRRFTIVGSSMGGNVAWEYALAHPDQVEGLVLVAASGWPETRAGLDSDPPIFALLRSPALGPLLRDLDTTALARQGLQASFAEPALATEDMVQRYVRLARAPGHRAILLQITLGFRERNFASAERLAPLSDLPTLILQGGQDRLVPADHARLFAQAIPGSSLVLWEEVGHIPQEEIPSVSVAALRAFLAARAPDLDAPDGAPSAVAPAP